MLDFLKSYLATLIFKLDYVRMW